jgi:hypothetical protein
MIRDYLVTSPSLDGILSHESITYEGITRPTEIIRAFDRPHNERMNDLNNPEKRQILQDYFHDLYGLFMKQLSYFITEHDVSPEIELKLKALLQELIKVKKLLTIEHIV